MCSVLKVVFCLTINTDIDKFYMLSSHICGSSMWSLLCVILLAPLILHWFLDLWKILVPLLYRNVQIIFKVLERGFVDNTRAQYLLFN